MHWFIIFDFWFIPYFLAVKPMSAAIKAKLKYTDMSLQLRATV